METCTNCKKLIGDRQPAMLIGEDIYCEVCHAVVSKRSAPPAIPAVPPPTLSYATPAAPVMAQAVAAGPVYQMQPGDIICPNMNCRFVGPGVKVANGSMAIGCLLTLLTLGLGILYFIIKSGSRIICPRCGMQIRNE